MKINQWFMNFMEYRNLPCEAPCSMYSVLLEKGLIEDPFYRNNELKLTELSDHDCEFYSDVVIGKEELEKEYLELVFEGLDTICDIYLNDVFLDHTENMHRSYVYDIRKLVKVGTNRIRLYFQSPTEYFRKMNAKHFLMTNVDTIEGAAHLRKALYMSGWDWGPTLPDMGIFREVKLNAYDVDRIESTIIHQTHKENRVDLTFDISTWKRSDCTAFVEINGVKTHIKDSRTVVSVFNPKLWWVRGYGEQNLYDITFTLEKDGKCIDRVKKRIGLRTLTISTEKVKDGNEFCFVNNGVKIFAMGANYIPQDILYARITYDTTKQRIEDFLFANYNCIRVWGGGYYPEDFFYDLCDEKGLIVWEDIMVACANVWLRDSMKEQFIEEVTQNLKRISHHASLGVICGNNEMEESLYISEKWDSNLLRMDYLTLYERIIPDLCEVYAPDTFYWASSPSSGGGFDDPRNPARGDIHYWKVWHGSIPFEEYRNHKFRFCSEYGFESFPNIKTIHSFCVEEDKNPFSLVMENHQKCKSGNSKILMYLSSKYLYPYSFERFVYASQILQAEAIRTGVEHFRRIRGYCMGSIYWQANDCWPVASWSSVDYYGRYKALHYAARKFYAPIAEGIFVEEDRIIVNVANETRDDVKVKIKWAICKNDHTVLHCGTEEAVIDALTSIDMSPVKIKSENVKCTYFYADLYDEEDHFIMRRTELLCPPKRFEWLKPDIQVSAENQDGGVIFMIKSDVFAKDVELDFYHHDVVLSDNYIDLVNDESYQIFCKTDCCAEELLADLALQSVYDIR